MTSSTQKIMFLAVLAMVIGAIAYVFSLDGGPEDPPDEPDPPVSHFQPGEPTLTRDASHVGYTPRWNLSGVFKNGFKSLQWGSAFLVWPSGNMEAWRGQSSIECRSVCGLTIKYVHPDRSEKSSDVQVPNECKPAGPIQFVQILGPVMLEPMDSAIPYADMSGFRIEVRGTELSPIEFGVVLRLNHLRNSDLEIDFTDVTVSQDSTLRFK
jgi:hypothetical protein